MVITSPRITETADLDHSVNIAFYSIRYIWRRHPQLQRVELSSISLFWPSLPSGIEAAYEDFDRDLIFLFKGNFLKFSSYLFLPEGWVQGFFVIPVGSEEVPRLLPGAWAEPLLTKNYLIDMRRLYLHEASVFSSTKREDGI